MSQNSSHLLVYGRYFVQCAYYVRHVLVALLVLLLLGGVAIAYLENLHISESIYFAFITGLTVGYGDIEPVTALGRVVSVAIAFVGLIFTGITVAVSTRALAKTVKHFEEKDKSSPS